MSKKTAFTLAIISLALLLVGLILTDVSPYLRGPAPHTSEWAWPFGWRPVSRWWGAALPALGVWLTAVLWFRQPNSQKKWATALFVIALMAGQILLQIGLIYAADPHPITELVARAYSKQTAGYFVDTISQTEQSGLGQFLADYPALMPTFPSEHMRTHPPGLPLLNWAAVALMGQLPAVADYLAPTVWYGRCTDLWLVDRDTAVAGGLWLIATLPLLIASTTMPLAYAVAHKLHPNQAATRLAAVLAGTIPALLIFAPITDQLFAPLALLALWLVLLAEKAGRKQAALWRIGLPLFGAGLTLSLLTLLSLGNGALVLPLAAWLAWQWGRARVGWRSWLVGGSTAVFGGLSLWLLYALGWGVWPWQIIPEALRQHYELVTLHRRYDWWLLWNKVDWLLFGGLVWFFVLPIWLTERGWQQEGEGQQGWHLWVVTVAMFLLLNLSGSARGEVGRLWLMGMPWLLVGGASLLAGGVRWPMGTLVGVQLGLTLALGWAWQPVQPVVVTAVRPETISLPNPQPINQPVAEGILWQAYTVEQTEDTVRVGLTWQRTGTINRPYTVFNHLLDESGALVAQADGWPGQGQWPPTCWAQAELVTDWFVLDTTAVAPGTYQLYTGLYDARDGTRPSEPIWLGEVEK
jgi:hypothetical protein